MNKAFIFDWSGTLNNNFDSFCQLCDLMFKELGKNPISKEEIKNNFTIPYMKFWNKYFPDLTKEKQCVIFEKYMYQVDEARIFTDVEKTIKILEEKRWKLFIVSADPLSRLNYEIKKSGLEKFFQKIYSDAYDKEKYIVSILKEFDLDKNQTFYVGDTSGDIEAGKHARVKTVGISWGFQSKEKLSNSCPDFLIEDISEITNIIK